MCTVPEQHTRDISFSEKNFSRFTEPSRGMSEAKVEQTSTETLSFRCVCERCRLMRGDVHKSSRKAAFTLAEVLITLGIIGVVAAITMPVLLSNVQDRVKAKRVENIKQKLSKVTDAMSATSGINGYADTMSFIQEMNKHMKIAKICDNSNLSACWPTKEVILDDEGKTWEISKTKNAKTLKINKDVADNWADTVGIVTADGTPMILSYKKDCDFDVDKSGLVYSNGSATSNSLNCLSGVFDWNGGKKPNKLAKITGDTKGDVLPFGDAQGLGNSCAFEIGAKCFITKPVRALSKVNCEVYKDLGYLPINSCYKDNDYWVGAVVECGGINRMPSQADLTELAKLLYNTPNIDSSGWTSNLTLDTSKATSLGITDTPFYVWSREEGANGRAYTRYFHLTYTGWNDYYYRDSSNGLVFCSGD